MAQQLTPAVMTRDQLLAEIARLAQENALLRRALAVLSRDTN
jgi:hypothetical protein